MSHIGGFLTSPEILLWSLSEVPALYVLASIVSLGIRLSSHRSCQDIHV